jgi:fermentation-respiration switch protein FrsA (DUF1100 family)
MLSYLLLFFCGLVAISLLLRWREPKMLYYPMTAMAGTPSQAGLAYEEVWLTTADGVKIHGWYLPGQDAAAPTFLFLHGNAGNISHRLEKLSIFHKLGAATLIIDYRGYGRSAGIPGEQGTYRDADAAYQWLSQRGVVPVLYGESLGTAVAVELAVTRQVAGIVLEAPFTSIAAVGQKLFPFLPVRWLVQNKYDSLSKMPRLRAPLLILHSREDEIFAMPHAEELLAAAPAPKQLVELRGGHNEAFLVSLDTYRTALAEFLRNLPSAN